MVTPLSFSLSFRLSGSTASFLKRVDGVATHSVGSNAKRERENNRSNLDMRIGRGDDVMEKMGSVVLLGKRE